jgi:hypothetical protein
MYSFLFVKYYREDQQYPEETYLYTLQPAGKIITEFYPSKDIHH